MILVTHSAQSSDDNQHVSTTVHFEKRLKDRANIKKRSSLKFINRAFENGLRIQDVKHCSKLFSYMKDNVREGYYGIIYSMYLLIVSEETDIGITVLYLPREYHKLVSAILAKKKGENNNG